jgi:hypothetical protein
MRRRGELVEMTLAVASHPRAKFVGQLSWLTSFQRETANVPPELGK